MEKCTQKYVLTQQTMVACPTPLTYTYIAPVIYMLLCLNLGFPGHRMTQHSRTGSDSAKWIRRVLGLSLMFAILNFHSK